jgi:hypothetical protein
MTSPRGWTPEEIAAMFPSTLGMELFNPAPAQPLESETRKP